VIPHGLIAAGVAFYDIQRGYGATERYARSQAVCYMWRKDPDASPDPMPFHEALADALATRASVRIAEEISAIIQTNGEFQ
jgi:hypothetical protein